MSRTTTDPRRMLDLDPVTIRTARSLARKAGAPVVSIAKRHTTVSVERAVLRLAGLEGADVEGIPWVNRLVDVVRADAGLEHGVALPVWDAMLRTGDDLLTVAQKAAAGSVTFRVPEGKDAVRAGKASRAQVAAGIRRIDANRKQRDRLIAKYGPQPVPWIYLIVATGDIYEDIPQAQAAARDRGHRAVSTVVDSRAPRPLGQWSAIQRRLSQVACTKCKTHPDPSTRS